MLVVEDVMLEETGAGLARRRRRYLPHLQVVRMHNRPASAEADAIAAVPPFTADDLIDAVRQAAAGATAAV